MNIPVDLKFTKTHEWIKIEGNKAKVGITDFAQHEITDVVHVELPENSKNVKKAQPAAVVESVKSAFDIYSPVSGKIVEVNEEVLGSPELINQDPYGKGFLFAVEFSDNNELADLLSAEEYKKII
ncbi:MAG: glycine cleavage system protein GcvH [Endomicrobia bacterium]|nr:glycine cleavage system protein GcvH [Endomicrobiia bacterium]MCL2799502.1 glycine cleavage system protein GcvH [Endomicrobiia bacterium]